MESGVVAGVVVQVQVLGSKANEGGEKKAGPVHRGLALPCVTRHSPNPRLPSPATTAAHPSFTEARAIHLLRARYRHSTDGGHESRSSARRRCSVPPQSRPSAECGGESRRCSASTCGPYSLVAVHAITTLISIHPYPYPYVRLHARLHLRLQFRHHLRLHFTSGFTKILSIWGWSLSTQTKTSSLLRLHCLFAFVGDGMLVNGRFVTTRHCIAPLF